MQKAPVEIIPMVITKEHIAEAGNLGGAYLDQIKKTDLATLSAEEWETFCAKIIAGAFGVVPTPATPF